MDTFFRVVEGVEGKGFNGQYFFCWWSADRLCSAFGEKSVFGPANYKLGIELRKATMLEF